MFSRSSAVQGTHVDQASSKKRSILGVCVNAVFDNMDFTDSKPFWGDTASIGVRENQRVAESGSGSNPHRHPALGNWHQGNLRAGIGPNEAQPDRVSPGVGWGIGFGS